MAEDVRQKNKKVSILNLAVTTTVDDAFRNCGL
jgi:hypothetical protein